MASINLDDARANGYDANAVPLSVPAANAAAVTPDNATDLANPTRGLYIGGAGNVVVDMVTSGSTITFTALALGVVHPLRVKRVRATGTTATGIVALY